MESQYCTIKQAAARLKVPPRSVRGYIEQGRLPAVRFGWAYAIAEADLATFRFPPRGRPPKRPKELL